MNLRLKFLSTIIRSIEEVESNSENTGNLTNWLSIASGISATAIIISAATLNPIPALFTTFFGVSSAAITIGGSVLKHQKETPVINNLKRYRLCLKSANVADWAAVWEIVGVEKFLDSLYEGATGQIFEGKLLRKTPSLNAVVDYIASCSGVTSQELINELKKVKNGRQSTLKLLGAVNSPTSSSIPSDSKNAEIPANTKLQGISFDELRKNAIAIRDALIKDSDNSRLPGCVILAAPGAGKTTFLGTAWLRLKRKYGKDFRSLAIVVKKDDVPSFQGISDQVLCVKTNPKKAAVEILKFIDSAMGASEKVSRLFLDDYLTTQKYFATGLKGCYVDLETFSTFDSKKEANESGSPDAVLLKDAFETALNEAWLVGREYNLCLWVSSHSSNVEDLPFMGSSDARSVGDFILLAKDSKRDFINNALNNQFLISESKKRTELKQQLESIKLDSQEPIILANYNNWTLGIVPQDVRVEYESLKTSTQETVIQPSVITELHSESSTFLQSDDSAACEDSQELNQELQAAQLKISIEAFKVLNKLKTFQEPTAIREIVRKRPFGREESKVDKIKYYLDELVIAELVLVSQEGDKQLYIAVTSVT
ncbi:MAG: hypothetical protein HC907_14995 [Richelia sp. SM1_7_0]|nr:hypothetical protein [Richelia sp. SM1_7_0]